MKRYSYSEYVKIANTWHTGLKAGTVRNKVYELRGNKVLIMQWLQRKRGNALPKGNIYEQVNRMINSENELLRNYAINLPDKENFYKTLDRINNGEKVTDLTKQRFSNILEYASWTDNSGNTWVDRMSKGFQELGEYIYNNNGGVQLYNKLQYDIRHMSVFTDPTEVNEMFGRLKSFYHGTGAAPSDKDWKALFKFLGYDDDYYGTVEKYLRQ